MVDCVVLDLVTYAILGVSPGFDFLLVLAKRSWEEHLQNDSVLSGMQHSKS